MKVKLPQSKILQIIQEEVDRFVKHVEHEERYGKLLDEFSSVFLEALELNDNALKNGVRNTLGLILEWAAPNSGFGNPTESPIQQGRAQDDTTDLKREIMMEISLMNRQQLQTVLNHVKSQSKTSSSL